MMVILYYIQLNYIIWIYLKRRADKSLNWLKRKLKVDLSVICNLYYNLFYNLIVIIYMANMFPCVYTYIDRIFIDISKRLIEFT